MTINLAEGDPLPSVGLRATDGYLLNLRSFVTKQPALLLFFGGPTLKGAARKKGVSAVEALSAGHERLREAGIAVAGISTDSEAQQTEFVKKHALPFLLLSDERRSAVARLKVDTVAEGSNVNVARPLAIAVDREGTVRGVIDPVIPETIVDQALRILSEPMPIATRDAAASA
jgi:peroxiredoxin